MGFFNNTFSDESVYEQLSETVILDKIKSDIGDPMKRLDLERKVVNMFNNNY